MKTNNPVKIAGDTPQCHFLDVYFLSKNVFNNFMYLICRVKTSNGKPSPTEMQLENSLC